MDDCYRITRSLLPAWFAVVLLAAPVTGRAQTDDAGGQPPATVGQPPASVGQGGTPAEPARPPVPRSGRGEGTGDARLSRGGVGGVGRSGDTASAGPQKYKNLRYDEDYSYLKDPALRTDFWDPLKYVPLFGRDDWYLSLGGETRQRFEYVRNDDLGGLDYGDGYHLQRYLLHADLHLGERVRLFAQTQSGFLDGRRAGPRPDIDRNVWDAHQGFVDLRWPTGEETSDAVTWRLGRQEMAYGSGRLIDTREGPSLRRSFDAARVLTRFASWTVDAWWSKPVRNRFEVFDDDPNPDVSFWGTYATRPIGDGSLANVDAYYLGYENKQARFEQGQGRELRHSVGTRLWGKPEPWEYNLEYVYQFGSFGPGNISAWTAAHAVRYNFSDLPLKPRPGIRFDLASGDRNEASATLNTFNPLFPSGVYFNLANPVGPANIIDLHPTFDLYPSDTVTVTLDWNFFWRESTNDGVYRLSGSLLRPDGGSSARFVGHSPAVTVVWNPTRHISVLASFVHFRPGGFLKDNPPAEPVNYFTTWLTYKF